MTRSYPAVLLSVSMMCWTGCDSREHDAVGGHGGAPANIAAGTAGNTPPALVDNPRIIDNMPVGGEMRPADEMGPPMFVAADSGVQNSFEPDDAGVPVVIDGSGVRGEQQRSVDAFDRIVVSDVVHAQVSFGPRRVVVSGDDNLLERVVTRVEGDALHLYFLPNAIVSLAQPMLVEITTPALSEAALENVANLTITDIKAAELKLDCMSLGKIEATGQVDQLTLSIRGAGEIDARDVQSKVVRLTGDSGGTLLATATDEVDGELESNAQATVSGRPAQRNVTISGGATISYP